MRLADWPRNPYLNDELREWVQVHLESLGVQDVAVYAIAAAGQDEERRVLVATEVGLMDSWYAPHGSTARFSLSVRLYPWATVQGVDLRGETFRLWAHEHQSRWRLRISRPALDTMADTPELGKALAEFAAACSVRAQPAAPQPQAVAPDVEDAVPAFLGRAAEASRAPIRVEGEMVAARANSAASAPPAAPAAAAPTPAPAVAASADDPVADLERRLGLRGPEG